MLEREEGCWGFCLFVFYIETHFLIVTNSFYWNGVEISQKQ